MRACAALPTHRPWPAQEQATPYPIWPAMTLPLIGLALIIVPLAELAVFFVVGAQIGALPTLAGILITAILGATMLRNQGLRTWREAEARLVRGEAPVKQLFDGLCLFVSGAFLLTPGFLTDFVGFVLLIPGFRQVLGGAMWRFVQRRGMAMNATMQQSRGGTAPGVVDAEYRVVDPEEPPPEEPPPGDTPPDPLPGPSSGPTRPTGRTDP